MRTRVAFRFDAVTPLAASGNPAIRYWARRDLVGDQVEPVTTIWETKKAQSLLRRQRDDGSWPYPAPRLELRSQADYDLIETFRAVGELVEKYGLDNRHPQLQRAAEYLLRAQSREGDIRGIYGAQYSPNYTAAILELVVKAGYGNDARVLRAFDWLFEIRQADGGWAIPLRTRGENWLKLSPPTLEPDLSRPFSHLVTGVVLRALAVHPRFRRRAATRHAAGLLASRLFLADTYSDRRGPEYWTRFSFPFWFTDLISALDSLGRVGYPAEDPAVVQALLWFRDRQRPDGLFDLKMLKTKDKDLIQWLALAVCRATKRFGVKLA